MADYPKLLGGTVNVQYPYEEHDEWIVAEASTDAGKSFTLPTGARRGFLITYDVIQRDDLASVEGFFRDMRGEFGEFNFVDDQGLAWPRARFGQPSIDIQYVQPNHYRLKVLLVTQHAT